MTIEKHSVHKGHLDPYAGVWGGDPNTDYEEVVKFEAHEHALAEKDLQWKRRVGMDCGNHNCFYAVEKTGMRTNGPCSCNPKRLKEDHEKLYARFEVQSRELDAIVTKLGCHRAYVLQELDQVIERADSKPGSDEYRQLQVKYNDLLRVAVKFAGYVKEDIYRWMIDDAKAFLATPAATALQQEDKWIADKAKLEDGCDVSAGHMPEALQQAKEDT